MKKLFCMIVALLLVSSVFGADLCTDTDNGGAKPSDKDALKNKGNVKYGITEQSDVCLTKEDGVSTNSSIWLKEYYCSSDQRMSHVYDCDALNLGACKDGACTGGSSSSTTTNTTTTTTTTTSVATCGNKILEKSKGEQCDPPNSVCFGRTTAEYGTCQSDCTCKISAAALKNLGNQPAVCGDSFKHADEDCEEDSDCPNNYVCSSCNCVKQLTAADIEAMKTGSKVSTETKEATPADKIEQEYNYTAPKIEIVAENFSDSAAIKATSGISNFFKKIFGWFASLFQ